MVDTSSDPAVSITRVYTAMEDGTYGVGEEVFITVVFSAPVRKYSACSEGLLNRTLTLHQTCDNPEKLCIGRSYMWYRR